MTVAHQEVGEPNEAAVEHRGLVDHGRVVRDRALGLCRSGDESGDGVGRAADHHHSVGEFFAQLREPASLVLVAESGGAR